MSEAIDIREIDPEKLYTLRQTADFLRCSYNTILKIKKNKEMPFQKIGKSFYAKGSTIINYIENGPQKGYIQGELL